MLFGGKKPEKTVLILDVESGSVGGALVRLTEGERPKLFGETRILFPVSVSLNGAALAVETKNAVTKIIEKISELAARLRLHPKAGALGTIARMAVFFATPWGRPDLAAGKPQFMPEIASAVHAAAEARLGNVPESLYTAAGVALFGNNTFFAPGPSLIYTIGGETSELLHYDGSSVRAHATLPLGLHAFIRTLRTHGGFSDIEARSLIRLGFGEHTATHREAMHAMVHHLGEHFAAAARELLHTHKVTRVRVVGEDAAAAWFAQALAAHEPLGALFPEGSEVRALRAPQLTAHIAVHQEVPDTRLMLGALFVDSRFNR